VGGGGGGAAGPTANGGAASGNTAGTGNTGTFLNGTAYSGSGGSGTTSTGTNAQAAPKYGGAGSGARASSATNRAGGGGRAGMCLITYTVDVNYPDLNVSLAGTTEVNGIYVQTGIINSRPYYYYAAQDMYIWFTGSAWLFQQTEMNLANSAIYVSFDTFATPVLVITWELDTGVNPTPWVQEVGGVTYNLDTVIGEQVENVATFNGQSMSNVATINGTAVQI
jgi:hypothetical protein